MPISGANNIGAYHKLSWSWNDQHPEEYDVQRCVAQQGFKLGQCVEIGAKYPKVIKYNHHIVSHLLMIIQVCKVTARETLLTCSLGM